MGLFSSKGDKGDVKLTAKEKIKFATERDAKRFGMSKADWKAAMDAEESK